MPITFGSVGDIISVCQLTRELTTALSESHGSAREYQSVVQDLRNLERILQALDLLEKTCDEDDDLVALGATARHHAKECKRMVEEFYDKIRKYDQYLKNGADKSVVADAYWKVRWRVTRKECLETFRTEIQGRVSALVLLLVTANLNLYLLKDNQLRELLAQSRERNALVCESWHTDLAELKTNVEKVNQAAWGSYFLGWVGLKCLMTVRSDLIDKMQMIWQVCLRTYNTVSVLNTQIPRVLNPWTQQPAIIDDALGRVLLLPLELVDSWKMLKVVLAAEFEGMPGERGVANGQYVLEDSLTKRRLDPSQNWVVSFRPGRRVIMSMVFTNEESAHEECPACRASAPGSAASYMTCPSCGLQYSRITEVGDELNSLNTLSASARKRWEKIIARKRRRLAKSQSPGPTSTTDCNQSNAAAGAPQDDIRDFRRVQLVRKQGQSRDVDADFDEVVWQELGISVPRRMLRHFIVYLRLRDTAQTKLTTPEVADLFENTYLRNVDGIILQPNLAIEHDETGFTLRGIINIQGWERCVLASGSSPLEAVQAGIRDLNVGWEIQEAKQQIVQSDSSDRQHVVRMRGTCHSTYSETRYTSWGIGFDADEGCAFVWAMLSVLYCLPRPPRR